MTEISQVEVSGIWIYPVKSLRGIALAEGVISHGRFTNDRNWIVVDERDSFMHQRDYPQMARVATELDDDGIVLSADGHGRCDVAAPMPAASESAVTYVRLWRRAVPSVPCDAHVNSWLSTVLGVRCRLMAFLPDHRGHHVPPDEVNSSFQDATPFHITSDASLADLNARMNLAIPMNRFRPNIAIRGATPFAEDSWKMLTIGNTSFRLVRECMRCVMTMTDQQKGERDRYEPLRTLSTYRRRGSEVAFGGYYVSTESSGKISLGDRVSPASEP